MVKYPVICDNIKESTMPKVITMRFTPELGMLIDEITDCVSKEQLRPITRTEVMQAALALYHSAIISGRISVILEDEKMGPRYREALALARGLRTLEQR